MTRRPHASVLTIRPPALLAVTSILITGIVTAGADTSIGSPDPTTSPQYTTAITRSAIPVILFGNTTETGNGQKLSSNLRQRARAGTGGISGEDDRVYVYIHVIDGVSTHTIDPYALNVTDRDETDHVAAAWVATSRLEELAALPDVISIREVIPPSVRSQDLVSTQAALNDSPGTPSRTLMTSAESERAMPAQSPGLLLPGVLASLAIQVVIKSRLYPR